MSTSMPFLYKTRSLSTLNLRQFNAFWQTRNISNRQYVYPPNNRCYSSAKDWGSMSPTITGENAHRPRRLWRSVLTRNVDGLEDTVHAKNLDSSSRDYQSLQRRNVGNKLAGMDDFGVPFEDEEAEWEEFDDEDLDLEAEESHNGMFEQSNQGHRGRTSTITVEEKNAFQRIFSDIFERRKVSGTMADYESSVKQNARGNMDQKKQRQAVERKLDSIMSTAVGTVTKTKSDVESIIQSYPEALRETAAKAMGAFKERNDSEGQTIVFTTTELERLQNVEAAREPERIRVESLMQNAKTDFELWEVMETEVFSLIEKLDLQDMKIEATSDEKPVRKTKDMKKKKSSKKKEEVKNENIGELIENEQPPDKLRHLEPKNGLSPLEIYGPLYPSFLLLGLRLLDNSFAKSSPLTVSLLPKIKSLGYISQVLGASTQFYNELLRIYYYRLDDFSGMIKLLEEMEYGALEMDKETYEIVLDAIKAQKQVRRGERGEALELLWRSPRYAPSKLRLWKIQIKDAMRNDRKEDETKYSGGVRSWEAV